MCARATFDEYYQTIVLDKQQCYLVPEQLYSYEPWITHASSNLNTPHPISMADAESPFRVAHSRQQSLYTNVRPKTSGSVTDRRFSMSTSAWKRRSGMDFVKSPPQTFHEFLDDYSNEAYSRFGDTAGYGQTPATDRQQSFTQSIKQGYNGLRSLGRRMSTTIRGSGRGYNEDPKKGAPTTLDMSRLSMVERPASRSSRWMLRSPSTRRRPSLPALSLTSTTRHSMIGLITGSPGETPPLDSNYFAGADARAAAAAHNEAFHATRPPPLPYHHLSAQTTDSKILQDSESGIGIDMDGYSRPSSPTVTVDLGRLDPMEILATELMEHILLNLDAASILRASAVSKKWQSLTLAPSLWKKLFQQEFIPRPDAVRVSRNVPLGIGKNIPDEDWQKMYRARKLIDRRWQNGEAAAIYLNGHKDSVYCAQFDGNKIITGSRDHTVRIWDTKTYQCIRRLGPPVKRRNGDHGYRAGMAVPRGNAPFCTLQVDSPDPSDGRRCQFWHDQSILCLQFDEEILVTGSSDCTCIVWSIAQNYRPLFRLQGHTAGVLDVCIDSTRIVTCSKDSTIRVWDRHTGALLDALRGHQGPVNAIQLRGDLLASASGDGICRLWRLDTGECVKEFSSQKRGLACVEFSEDGRYVYAGGNDQVIYGYNVQTGEIIRQLHGHTDLVRSLHLDSASGRIISGSYDHSVKIWDSDVQQTRSPASISFDGWTSSWILSAKSDYRKIVCTSQDGRIVIMDFGYGIDGVDLLDP